MEWYSIDNRPHHIPTLRQELKDLMAARETKDYAKADAIRQRVLAESPCFRITIKPDRITLWDVPTPPLTGQFHYANFPYFVCNTNEK
jgi:hypothetical protein